MQLLINDKEYHLPERWTEVRLGAYMRFMAAFDTEADETEQQVMLLSAFTGAPQTELLKCKKSDIDEAVKALALLTNKPINSTLNMVITVDGVDYGFHPKLKDLTMAEFVDLDKMLQEGWDNMHRVMSILYRPIVKTKGDKYAIEDYDYIKCREVAKKFKESLSIATVNGAAAFFLNTGLEYMKITQTYLKKQAKKKQTKGLKQTATGLPKSTAGMELSTP